MTEATFACYMPVTEENPLHNPEIRRNLLNGFDGYAFVVIKSATKPVRQQIKSGHSIERCGANLGAIIQEVQESCVETSLLVVFFKTEQIISRIQDKMAVIINGGEFIRIVEPTIPCFPTDEATKCQKLLRLINSQIINFSPSLQNQIVDEEPERFEIIEVEVDTGNLDNNLNVLAELNEEQKTCERVWPIKRALKAAKDRFSLYGSDMTDGFSLQVMFTILSMTCCVGFSNITFSTLYLDQGISFYKTLVGCMVAGMMSSLLFTQPITIFGTTGDLFIYEATLLFVFENVLGLPYRPMKVLISMWLIGFAFFFIILDFGKKVIKWITRFSVELFSIFAAFVYFKESIAKKINIFKEHPLEDAYGTAPAMKASNSTMIGNGSTTSDNLISISESTLKSVVPQPNTALLSLILFLATIYLISIFKKFRKSQYFNSKVRDFVGFFGVPIAVVLMTGTYKLFFHMVHIETIDLSAEGMATSSEEEWIVNPFDQKHGLPLWAYIAAIIPAYFASHLIVTETCVCLENLQQKQRKLAKPFGFTWDITVSLIMNCFLGVWGAPFMSPGVVKTLNHVEGLSVLGKENGSRSQIDRVYEQRVSAFFIALLSGVWLLPGIESVASSIPQPVLFGVFMNMGISATTDIEFLERFSLLFKARKHHPNKPFVTEVKMWRMHTYTLAQAVSLLTLIGLTMSPYSHYFLVAFAAIILIEKFLFPLYFHKDELKALNSSAE